MKGNKGIRVFDFGARRRLTGAVAPRGLAALTVQGRGPLETPLGARLCLPSVSSGDLQIGGLSPCRSVRSILFYDKGATVGEWDHAPAVVAGVSGRYHALNEMLRVSGLRNSCHVLEVSHRVGGVCHASGVNLKVSELRNFYHAPAGVARVSELDVGNVCRVVLNRPCVRTMPGSRENGIPPHA